ncbi:hypothetical protein, partial [Hallerella succinigenes]|uniref:hypothetical protein n=1 Tax=Hallerella succinigenes TaxID=1896222 RepID=UPI002A826A3E
RFISIIHFKSFVIIVTQLADRISIIVKGFFHDRQKASLEPPAQLVVFGLYTKAKKNKKAYDGCHTLFDNL